MLDETESLNTRKLYRFTLLVFLVYKAVCISAFGLQYTDSDQTVMWQAAMDMSGGNFHNLFWYGQTYSSNLESLLAVPLLWMKVPVYLALPIVSGLLSLLPIILFADIAARNNRYAGAILVLLFSLAFPVEHWQTSMLSRGFIQGIACVSLGIYIIYRTRMSVMFSVAGLLIAGGIWQNPNAVFLLSALPLMTHRFRPLNRITIALSGAVAATLMWFALRALAVRHMEYVVHPEPALDWRPEYFMDHIVRLKPLLSHSFYLGIYGIIFLTLFIFLVPKNKYLFISVSLLLTLFLIIIGFKKTGDFSDNIFFGPARFFLAIPYVLLFFVSFTEKGIKKISSRIFIAWFFGVAGYMFVQHSNIQFMCREYAPVFVEKISELRKNCSDIKKISKERNTQFVLMGDHYMLETVTCGCSGIDPEFPVALRPKYERRGWLWSELGKQIPGKVLFMESQMPLDTIQTKFTAEKVQVRGNGYLLSTGNLNNREIMQRLFPAEHFH
jgi:hypothetical protein